MIDAGGTDLRERILGLRGSILPSEKDPKKLQDDWKPLTSMDLESPHSKSSA